MVRRVILLAIGAVLVAAMVGCGGKEAKAVTIADPLAEALAHAPAGAAVLAVVDTAPQRGPSAALARLAAGALASGGAGGLDVGAGAVAGAPAPAGPLDAGVVVVWSPDGRTGQQFTARVVADGPALGKQLETRREAGALTARGDDGDYALYTERAGGALARRGPVLVSAPDLAALRAVLRRRRDGRAQWTPRLLAERTLGLPATALARVALDAQALVARRGGDARRLPWVAALRRAAVTLTPEVGALRARIRVTTAPGLAPAELPLVTGAAPPAVHGSGPLTASVRGPRQTVEFLRRTLDLLDPALLGGLRDAEGLLDRYAGVSLQQDLTDQLTGSATVTSRDARTFTLRSDLADPERTRDALGRVGTLARFGGPLAGLVGVDLNGFDVDEQDEVFTIKQNGDLLARLAVVGKVLVASTDPRADLKAAGQAPAGATPPSAGALRATLSPGFLRDGLLPRLGAAGVGPGVLEPFGDAVLLARSAPDGLDAQLILPVR